MPVKSKLKVTFYGILISLSGLYFGIQMGMYNTFF